MLRTELEPLVEKAAQAIFDEHYYAHEEPERGYLAKQHPHDIERAMRQARAALEAAGVQALLIRIEGREEFLRYVANEPCLTLSNDDAESGCCISCRARSLLFEQSQ